MGSRHDALSGQPRGGIFSCALSHGPLQRVWVCILVVPSLAKFCVSSPRAFSSVLRKQSCHTIHRCAPACLSMLSPRIAHNRLHQTCCAVRSAQRSSFVFNQIWLAPSQQAQRENETAQGKAWRGSRRSCLQTRGTRGTQGPVHRVFICCHRGPDANKCTANREYATQLALFIFEQRAWVLAGPAWLIGLACSTWHQELPIPREQVPE